MNSRPTAQGWTSAITETTADGINIGGYDIVDLAGSVPFTSVVHLMHTGRLPLPPAARLLEALMVASIDHGPGTPSSLAARTAASGGANLQGAAAAGLLAMGDFHAAAVGDCMQAVVAVADAPDQAAKASAIIAERRDQRRRLSGFGHRQHTERDPRIDKLFAMVRAEGFDGRYTDAAETLEATLASAVGRNLPINIDGAYAAVLAEIDIPAASANAIFISSRMAGVLAHVVEELTTQPPMRRIDPVDHRYSGPAPRPITGEHRRQEAGGQQDGEQRREKNNETHQQGVSQ